VLDEISKNCKFIVVRLHRINLLTQLTGKKTVELVAQEMKHMEQEEDEYQKVRGEGAKCIAVGDK